MRIYLFACCFMIVISCGKKETKFNPVESNSSMQPKDRLNVQVTSFTEIDSSGILLFPLEMGETEKEDRSYYKDLPSGHWNIVFYNTRTQEHYLLSERKMLINGYNLENDDESANGIHKTPYLFYNIITDDLNKDKKLTAKDPSYLFITSRDGRNIRQVSPPGYDLHTWEYIPGSNKIILIARNDTDKNGSFDEEDELSAFEADLNSDAGIREIFGAEFKNTLKTLYDRDWKKLRQ